MLGVPGIIALIIILSIIFVCRSVFVMVIRIGIRISCLNDFVMNGIYRVNTEFKYF